MPVLLVLPHPGVNAVFFGASETLALSELSLLAPALDAGGRNAHAVTLCGVRYDALEMDAAPTEGDLKRLSRLSFAYALFLSQTEPDEGALLRPLPMDRGRVFSEDVSAILKYTGKTNALFTRWLLQMAALSLQGGTPAPRVLDPLCGRGTTLFEAAMLGWDAAGVELQRASAHEAAVFFRKYLENGRFKHTVREEKRYGAPCWDFRFAPDKDALRFRPGALTLVNGDGAQTPRYFGREGFDIVCGDLPYGVQHGSVADGGDRARTPGALLGACLPAWRECLRPGGVLALSWNLPTLPREKMLSALTAAGLSPLCDPPYEGLSHRVDASITRDAVFARKAV